MEDNFRLVNPKLERYALTRVLAVSSESSKTPGLRGKALVLSTGEYTLALTSSPEEIGVFTDQQLDQFEAEIVQAVRKCESMQFVRFGSLRCSTASGVRCVAQLFLLPQPFVLLCSASTSLNPALFHSQKKAMTEAGEAADALIGGLDWTRVAIPAC